MTAVRAFMLAAGTVACAICLALSIRTFPVALAIVVPSVVGGAGLGWAYQVFTRPRSPRRLHRVGE